jgi:hypothetical protein
MTPTLPRRSGPHTALPRLHVAIIMDGNGRWAQARALPRSAGHHAGVRTARTVVEAAVRAGIGTLTLYAFSSDNWARPRPEVVALMRLFRRSLLVESKRCLENGVRLSIVGRRDRLPASLRQTISQAEAITAGGRNLHLRVAVDYSSREGRCRSAHARAFFPASGRGGPRSHSSAGCGPAHPHGWRTASQRFPSVGVRLRGTGILAHDVARFRRGRPAASHRGVRGPRAPLRQGTRAGCVLTGPIRSP